MSPDIQINKFMNRLMRYTPNILGIAGVGFLAVVGGIMAGVGLGKYTKPLNSVSKAINESLDERNKAHDTAFTELKKMEVEGDVHTEQQKAIHAALYATKAAAIAPHVITAAEKKSEAFITYINTAAEGLVIGKKAEGKGRVINKQMELDIQKADQQTINELALQKVDHHTSMTQLLGDHYHAMEEKTVKLGQAIDNTNIAATKYTSTATATSSLMMKLNLLASKAIGAHAELDKQLHLHDEQNLRGEVSQETSEAVHKAIMNVIRAEGALDAQIEVSDITSKLELRESIAKEFMSENRKLDSWLGSQAKDTLTNLADIARTAGKSAVVERFSEKVQGMITDAIDKSDVLESAVTSSMQRH